MPQDHEEQLQLGMRIITTAYRNKTNALEQEIRSLKMTYDDQKDRVSQLSKKNSQLEVELVENHQRSQQLQEENKELFKTVNLLRKQVGKLEKLKQLVTSHIQDHEGTDGETRALMSDEYLRSSTPLTSAELGYGASQGRNQPGTSTSFGGAGKSSPIGNNMSTRSVALEETQMLPPRGDTRDMVSPVIDGKEFFRQARSALSYEAFNEFLASIKRLNNNQQTREETLAQASNIFGPEQQGLYKEFEALLNRHGADS